MKENEMLHKLMHNDVRIVWTNQINVTLLVFFKLISFFTTNSEVIEMSNSFFKIKNLRIKNGRILVVSKKGTFYY